MLLQSSLHQQNVSLSSSLCYSRPLPRKISTSSLPQTLHFQTLSIRCSISKIHGYGTVDYERRPIVRWNDIYRRISLMKNPELGSASVLNQWENEGKNLTKWELCRVVKELRKYKRHDRALEVYDWMNNRGERFRLSASDAAIQLDLVAKVRGVSSAEEYFLRLADKLKDRRTYGALLNAYVRGKKKEKAESLLDLMRTKGYATHSLPFNVMMTLYMNLKEYDKVDLIVSEMIEKKIQLDIYSYNIWLSSCGSQGSAEKMEEVFEQMVKDNSIIPNWTTFSTLATMYIKMDMLEKAEECLRKVESRIRGRDRIPYHYLLSLYGSVGKKEEVYRVWNTYKSVFPTIPNLGYHAIISSLVRIGDIEGAEKLYEEWLSVKSSYDARIGNLLLAWYVKNGNTDKAQDFFKHMHEVGGKPNSNTWEVLAEGHIGEKRISEALSCFKEAFMDEASKSWKPKPVNVSAFFNLCEDEDDTASREVLIELMRKLGHHNNEVYASITGLSDRTYDNNDDENRDDGDSQMLMNQLEGSL
ncbi:pentatricopeptide repeat-containing protein [Senna tora]|uniref:Pentatricopeptide repeat-containing protein n=1 Tax=Senna tora TaxID=362788 RepID=A0A835CN02_9FABA|nr:pentatricopeptide repeat-containing protein [Senna tora]